jgi:outer membrane lipoprotein-sorting protein
MTKERNATRVISGVWGAAAVFLLSSAPAHGQTPPEQQTLMAEDVFKNVQVLKGISVNEFMETMGFFSAALGYNCTNCHVEESLQNWAKFADDVPAKKRARGMILMVNGFNKNNFGGKRALTCYTCHHGAGIPKITPSLAEQYGAPLDDPNEVEIFAQDPNAPTADQILERYIQALGGAQRLIEVTSFIGTGKYSGFDTSDLKVPVEVFAKAPGQRTVIVHGPLGDSTSACDGRAGWIAGPDKPVPVLALAGADLDGLKLDGNLSFPGGIKRALGQWRVGFPATLIDDREVDVVQGTTSQGSRVKLYFDRESGLLARLVRFTETVVGLVPTQIDYSDYREVAGVKMPFKWTFTWTDGQSTTELSEVRANVPIDAAKFARPAAPATPRSRTAAR